MRTTSFRCAVLLACLWAGSASAQVPEDVPSPSDRLPFQPLMDDSRTSPPFRAVGEPLLEMEPLETDRDSFTPATSTVDQGWLIVESAYSFIDQRGSKDTHSFPEFIARYGLADWFELRFGASYEVGGAGNSISSGGGGPGRGEPGEIESESQLLYGFKIGLTQQDAWKPRSALILQGTSPTSGTEATSQFVGTYVLGWQFANGWMWDSSVRFATDEFEADRHSLWAPSTVIKVPVGERWNAHAEYFGIRSSGLVDPKSDHYFSPGMHYLVTNDLELGVRVGWGRNDDAANFFTNVGFGWRM